MKNDKLCNKIKIGDTFGDLTITKLILKNGSYKAECRCLCGEKHTTYIYHLFNGNTTSCGCGLFKIRKRGGDGHTTYKWSYRIYIINSKKRNRKFDLSLEEFKKIIIQNCYYCGSEPQLANRYLDRKGKQKRKNKKYQKTTIDIAYAKINGIDRINNDLGYVKNNCLPCCVICNRAKNSMEYKDFIEWLDKIKFYKRND